MIVRRAKIEECSEIARIQVSSWREAYRDIIPEAYLSKMSVTEREARWSRIVGNNQSCTRLAIEKDRIYGFISFGASRENGALEYTGEIYALYVDPRQWSRGVGRQLVRETFREFPRLGFSRCQVRVLSENSNAIGFYQHVGFEQCTESTRLVEVGGAKLSETLFEATVGSGIASNTTPGN